MTGTEVITFGCRLNAVEAAILRRNVEGAGLADAVVVNTCAVTGEAERQARQAIRRARRLHPMARIVVTGCAAQISPESFARMPEVDHVLGNREKLDPETFQRLARARAGDSRVLVADIMAVRETAPPLVDGFDGRARAFVRVQQGCDHRCTFCVIPFARGASRSAPLGAIVEETRALVARGYAEVVLTGVDLTAYGADLPGRPSLGSTVRDLLARVPELPRLRLSSLDPAEVDEDLVALFAAEPRLMPHLHLSLQSGDDLILKRMKRRHSREGAVRFCERMRGLRPETAFGADLIAGFPTETEAHFRNTLALVGDCGLTHLHVFPFSARPGTPAARMPQTPRAVVRERAHRLREAGEAFRLRFLATRVGRVESVLVEREDPGEGVRSGYSEHYLPVAVTGPARVGRIVRVRVDAASTAGLRGTALS